MSVCVCVYECECVYVYELLSVCITVCVCVCVYMSVSVYITAFSLLVSIYVCPRVEWKRYRVKWLLVITYDSYRYITYVTADLICLLVIVT